MVLTKEEIQKIADEEGSITLTVHANLLRRDRTAIDIIKQLSEREPPLKTIEIIDILRDAEWWVRTLAINSKAQEKEDLRRKTDKEKIKEKIDNIQRINLEIRKILEKHTPEKYPTYYEIDTLWGCEKSPFGWCCYNHYEDPAHDRCIFCGKPQERK